MYKVEKMAYIYMQHYRSVQVLGKSRRLLSSAKNDKYTIPLSLSYLKVKSIYACINVNCSHDRSVCSLFTLQADRAMAVQVLWLQSNAGGTPNCKQRVCPMFSLGRTRAANITLCAGAEISNYCINKYRQVSIKMTDTCQS